MTSGLVGFVEIEGCLGLLILHRGWWWLDGLGRRREGLIGEDKGLVVEGVSHFFGDRLLGLRVDFDLFLNLLEFLK